MAKEKKIGVIAIAVLFVVFAAIVVMKLTGGENGAVAADDGEPRVALKPQENPKLAGGPAQPRYLAPEKNNTPAPVTLPIPGPSKNDAAAQSKDRYQWQGADRASKINAHKSAPANLANERLRPADKRYAGRYRVDGQSASLLNTGQGDQTVGSVVEDPFPSRGSNNPTTAELSLPAEDPWARAADKNLAPGADALAAVQDGNRPAGNPLRQDAGQPARLAAAELPSPDSTTGSSRRERYPSGGSANIPAGTDGDFTVVQHTQPPAAQYPQYQQPHGRAADVPPADPAYDQRPNVAPGTLVVGPNDNYWAISSAVYGSGKYFKALYEHNRHRYPAADDLHVGDSLDVPPVTELEELYPDLCPRRRRSVQQPRGYTVSSVAARSGQVYVVQQGDTLFNIARQQLGKAALWAKIYELNRDQLGDDIDFVSPGMQLVLPGHAAPQRDIITRRPGRPLHR